MDFFEAVKRRQSCRKFTNEPVPKEVMEQVLEYALLAPNTSNIQPWEFYWVQSPQKKKALAEACFNQNAARTAAELVVAVSRIDTWKRNRDMLMKIYAGRGPIPPIVTKYYMKLLPLGYRTGPLGLLGLAKWPVVNLVGLFRPAPRKVFRWDLFESVTKTTALACENIMLGMAAHDFDSCPMEGFDEVRVKKILGLNRKAHVVMVIGIGKGDPSGFYGERTRLPSELFIKKV